MVYPDGNGYFKLENDTVITGNGDLFDLVIQEIVENRILMQSTGLKDKNGKLIYEGDIIKCSYDSEFAIGVIEWDSEELQFALKIEDAFLFPLGKGFCNVSLAKAPFQFFSTL